ncbi:hypothetical protein C8Q80DRAFT_621206 [Daedaleopsis nitida]|nr:hypothetical protein C8Q80DRAFT_621206 [Daedaleopsis nitida]
MHIRELDQNDYGVLSSRFSRAYANRTSRSVIPGCARACKLSSGKSGGRSAVCVCTLTSATCQPSSRCTVVTT